jgi:hypothetical protein
MDPPGKQEDVTIEMDDRFFRLTLSIKDETLIEEVLHGLAKCVQGGASLRIRQTHRSALSESQHMTLKIISNQSQMNAWLEEAQMPRCVVCTAKERTSICPWGARRQGRLGCKGALLPLPPLLSPQAEPLPAP